MFEHCLAYLWTEGVALTGHAATAVKREVLALPNNPNTDSATGVYQGWNIRVRRVYDPEAVREGRRVMGELLVQTLLGRTEADSCHGARTSLYLK